MPGKGCLLRKALRRAERAQEATTQPGGELGETCLNAPPAKVAKLNLEAYGSLQQAKEAGLLAKPERVWAEVAPLKDLSDDERTKAMQLCYAMYEAVEENKGKSVTISNLGAHFKVQKVKKDPFFANQRLLDLVQRHLDVFDLVPDGVTNGGWAVKIKTGVKLTNQDFEMAAGEFESSLLPARIEEPGDFEEKCQAFRIECIHALFKRGSKVQLNELGQDPHVTKRRAAIGGASRKLLDLVNQFPQNFSLEDQGHGNFTIELVSTEVTDTSMLPGMTMQTQAMVGAAPHLGSPREGLVNQVKAYQRAGVKNKLKWYEYCTGKGSTSFDPLRHTDEVLEGFIAAAEAGVLPEPDEEAVAEAAQKEAEITEQKKKFKGKGYWKGKGKGGPQMSPMMRGGPDWWGAGAYGSGPDWYGGGYGPAWDDEWGMEDAMNAFMTWYMASKGKGKGKGKGEKGDRWR